MALLTKDGISVSFESGKLIREAKQDIEEFGGRGIVAVWVKDYDGAQVITNYDFIDADMPITEEEISDGEKIQEMSLEELLRRLEEQDAIV